MLTYNNLSAWACQVADFMNLERVSEPSPQRGEGLSSLIWVFTGMRGLSSGEFRI